VGLPQSSTEPLDRVRSIEWRDAGPRRPNLQRRRVQSLGLVPGLSVTIEALPRSAGTRAVRRFDLTLAGSPSEATMLGSLGVLLVIASVGLPFWWITTKPEAMVKARGALLNRVGISGIVAGILLTATDRWTEVSLGGARIKAAVVEATTGASQVNAILQR